MSTQIISLNEASLSGENLLISFIPESDIENDPTYEVFGPDVGDEVRLSLFPCYSSLFSRMQTFRGWPKGLGLSQHPAELSKSGFFYTGYKDKLTCFSCGESFVDWMPNDIPDERHAARDSDCLFLKVIKGEDFIRNCTSAIIKDKNFETITMADDKNKEDEEKRNDLNTSGQDEKFSITCKICMELDADVAVIPCGHVFSCIECIFKTNNKCSICRKSIKDIVKIFF